MQSTDHELADVRQQLLASEARFRSVVEGTLHGIIIQQAGRIVYANNSMARLFGYDTADQLLGLSPFEDLIEDGDLDVFRARTEAVYEGKLVEPHPGWRARHRHGEEVWISSSGVPTMWDGKPAVTSFYVDITERRRTMLALRESEARYRTALTAGRMGAWETDLATRVRKWTPEGMDLFGISKVDGLGRVSGDADEYMATIHPEDRPLVRRLYSAADAVDSFPADYRIVRPDGTIAWLSGRGQVSARWEDGRARRLVSIMADVTDRKMAERQTEILLREMSHRSKNLLTLILAIARQSAGHAPSVADFTREFTRRLEGLSASYELLVTNEWQGANLADLVRNHFVPFIDPESSRLTIGGPDVAVSPSAAQALGLALNELATNATKYGALSGPAGCVSVLWSVEDGEPHKLRISWTERDGPAVVPPAHEGFGSILLRRIVGATLRGQVSMTFAAEGFAWAVEFPLGAGTSSMPSPPAAR